MKFHLINLYTNNKKKDKNYKDCLYVTNFQIYKKMLEKELIMDLIDIKY